MDGVYWAGVGRHKGSVKSECSHHVTCWTESVQITPETVYDT